MSSRKVALSLHAAGLPEILWAGFWQEPQPSSSSSSREAPLGDAEIFVWPDRLDNRRIRERVVPVENRSRAAVGNMVRAVGSLERWWWRKYKECRPMEGMPAEDLDKYLAEYFMTLRRPNGSDYEQASLKNFRSLLDRFLRDHKYPHSLCKSNVFVRSQRAFRIRRNHLIAQSLQ